MVSCTERERRTPVALPHPLLIELGVVLGEYRERLRIDSRDVENHPRLRWYSGKCGRVEAGYRTLEPAELHVLADLYGITDEHVREELLKLSEVGGRKETIRGVPEFARPLVLLERYAHAFDYCDESLWPGFVQTPGYATELITRGVRDQAGVLVEEERARALAQANARIAARTARGEVLTRAEPPAVRLLMGMSAVRRLPADPDAAEEQLTHVLDLLDVVKTRFIPDGYGLYPLLGNPCNLFHFHRRDTIRTQVYLEAATSSELIATPAQVAVYKRRFDRLFDEVPDESESARLLRERIQQLRTRRRHDGQEMGSA
jgi:hypothetical protein